MSLQLDGTNGISGPNTVQGGLGPTVTVQTLSDLKSLIARPSTVIMSGYYTSNDGGGGIFNWVPGDTTTPDDALIIQPTSGISGRYKRIISGPYNIKWFGAKGDGSTNDSPAIQSAINAKFNAGGGSVYAPSGTYILASTVDLKANVILQGDKDLATMFRALTNITLFRIFGTNNTTPISSAKIKDCSIWANGLGNSANIGVSSRWTNRCELEKVRFFGCYAGYKGLDAWQFYVTECWADGGGTQQNRTGYWLASGGDDTMGNNAHVFQNSSAQDYTNVGLRIENGTGSIFYGGQFMGGQVGIDIGNPTVSTFLQFMFFNGVQTDTTVGAGIVIDGNNTTFQRDIAFTDVWAGLVTTINQGNVIIRNYNGSLRFNGLTAENSSYNLVLENSSGLQFSGLQLGNYDSFNTGAASIVLTNSSRCTFSDIHATPSASAVAPSVGLIETGTSNSNILILSRINQYIAIGDKTIVKHNIDLTGNRLPDYPEISSFPTTFGSIPLNIKSINQNNYPATGMIPAGVLQQNSAAMIIPASYTQTPWPNVNYAGYIENQGTLSGQSGVNYFGTSISSTSNSYGANFNGVVANSSATDPYGGPGTGHNFGHLVGLELNQNIRKVGVSTPTGTVEAIRLIGGGDDVRPTGGAFGMNIFPLAGFGGGSPTYWTALIFSQDAAASTPENQSYFASIGATGTGNNVPSQSITGRARSAGGTNVSGHIQYLQSDHWFMTNGLSVGPTPQILDTNARFQTYDSAASLRISSVLKNNNGGVGTAVALGFNTTNSVGSETSVSKGGIGWTRNNIQGVGYGSLFARSNTDTSSFTTSDEVLRWQNGTVLIFGELQLTSTVQVGSGAYLIKSSVAFANGAAGNSATLTNAPAAGNPTKWIAISDNGTTRYIPAW